MTTPVPPLVPEGPRARYSHVYKDRCLGVRRSWAIYDENRGGMALGPAGNLRQFASKATAEAARKRLNREPRP